MKIILLLLLCVGLAGYSRAQTGTPPVAAAISGTFAAADTTDPHHRAHLPVPENYYTKGLGFFCRQELKMQQAHVPVTFRLGSMENCNRLEQKPGYR